MPPPPSPSLTTITHTANIIGSGPLIEKVVVCLGVCLIATSISGRKNTWPQRKVLRPFFFQSDDEIDMSNEVRLEAEFSLIFKSMS